jgi:Ser/Thr protein kinase RdoA (MazF antagonist)
MQEIIAQFCDPAAWPDVEPVVTVLGVGNINDTWLVRRGALSFVLQRLSRQVFLQPHLVMVNLATLSRHLADKVNTSGQRWENSVLLATNTGAPFYTDHQGDIWRAVSYVDRTTTHQAITTPAQARQVGWALGHFHLLLADLPARELHETLPGFHILPCYLDHFDRVLSGVTMKNDADLRCCLDFVAARRTGADLLEQARHQGRVRVRTIHGDPKVGNVLFDIATDCAVSLIDLDTVGPGLIHYDIGDCLRSCCNVSGEAAPDLSQVIFDVELCREVLAGYFCGAGGLLSGHDRELIFHAVRLIAFELGLRFLTDYLAGNSYFKVSHVAENLHRALVQFRLVQSIENQQRAIEKIALTPNVS